MQARSFLNRRMRHIFLSRRSCRIPFKGDGIRPYDARATEVVQHRCLATNTATKSSPNAGCDFRSQAASRRRGHHQLFQNASSNCQSQLHHPQRLQVRHFVFDSRKAKKSKTKKDPFKVLKVPKESLYKDVKTKFLRIAMANHPDMHSDGLSEKEQEDMRNKFIEARMAFERLEEDPTDGKAILVEELIDRERNFDSWFKNETGLKNPFDVDIDPETMKEVAEMTEKLGGNQGMDRDGGMWALARMVTSAVKSGGDAASILRLESGDVKQRPGSVPGGSLRRPRRR